jgi:exoribonuclease R
MVNSALSLAVNLTIAQQFLSAGIGLFRIMAPPTDAALKRLRREVHALGIHWPSDQKLTDLLRSLEVNQLMHRRFLMMVRRAGGPASYASLDHNSQPWHAAMGAAYVHATAPMRRLADRYVLQLSYRLFHALPISDNLRADIAALPQVMDSAAGKARSVGSAILDFVEALTLQGRIGETLVAEVVDAQSGMVQALDGSIRSRVASLPRRTYDGDLVKLRIVSADPLARRVTLSVDDSD